MISRRKEPGNPGVKGDQARLVPRGQGDEMQVRDLSPSHQHAEIERAVDQGDVVWQPAPAWKGAKGSQQPERLVPADWSPCDRWSEEQADKAALSDRRGGPGVRHCGEATMSGIVMDVLAPRERHEHIDVQQRCPHDSCPRAVIAVCGDDLVRHDVTGHPAENRESGLGIGRRLAPAQSSAGKVRDRPAQRDSFCMRLGAGGAEDCVVDLQRGAHATSSHHHITASRWNRQETITCVASQPSAPSGMTSTRSPLWTSPSASMARTKISCPPEVASHW